MISILSSTLQNILMQEGGKRYVKKCRRSSTVFSMPCNIINFTVFRYHLLTTKVIILCHSIFIYESIEINICIYRFHSSAHCLYILRQILMYSMKEVFLLHENIFVYNYIIIWSCNYVPYQMYHLPQSIVIQISSFQKSPGISILTIFPIKYHVIKRWEE